MNDVRFSGMRYWRDQPETWLLDERFSDLPPEVFFGFFWLRQRGRREIPPGVFRGDDATLAKWSRLPRASWEIHREKILALFELDSAGNFHDEESKKEFRSFQKVCHEKSAGAKARWKKGEAKPSQEDAKFIDPYSHADFAKSSEKQVMQRISIPYAMDTSDREIEGLIKDRETGGVAPPAFGRGEAPPRPDAQPSQSDLSRYEKLAQIKFDQMESKKVATPANPVRQSSTATAGDAPEAPPTPSEDI